MTIEEVSKMCDEDPIDTIHEFAKIFFLVQPGLNEKEFLQEKREQQLTLVQGRQMVDRMGLAISE